MLHTYPKKQLKIDLNVKACGNPNYLFVFSLSYLCRNRYEIQPESKCINFHLDKIKFMGMVLPIMPIKFILLRSQIAPSEDD